MKQLTLSFFFLFTLSSFSQAPDISRQTDSLRQLIESPDVHDTIKLRAYKTWDDLIYLQDPQLDKELNQKILTLTERKLKLPLTGQERLFYKKAQRAALNNFGAIYTDLGDFGKAVEFHEKALQASEEIGDESGKASALSNLGIICKMRGEFTKAIDYYTQGLRIQEKLGDKKNISNTLNNIGIIYADQGDKQKAADYFHRSLALRREVGDKRGVGTSLGNLGLFYYEQHQLEKAMQYHQESLLIQQEIGDKKGQANSLNNIGSIYTEQKNYAKAMEFCLKSLELREQIGDKRGLATSYKNLGSIYLQLGDMKKALDYGKQALAIGKELGVVFETATASGFLSEAYKRSGNHKEALEMFELHIQARDSMRNEENQKAVIRQEMQYNYEKQKALDAIEHEKEKAISEETARRQKVITIAVLIGLLLVILFAFFIVNRLRLTRRQKLVIEQQKGLVEEKQKEVLDSITYAKRLQEAILPPVHFVKEHFPDSFIYYRPKDIIAGDFYWMETRDDEILIAAADCTGHGVPGAIVSVVCSNALNRVVLEFGITDPGKILDKTREVVLGTFSRSDKEVKDGMDISLARFNKRTGELSWAGANNPLWYIREGSLHEITATKQSIGSTDKPKSFTTHTFQLSKGDLFFLFTDGYADQFGGEKGKKFKYQPLKELLLSLAAHPAEKQKEKIDAVFNAWKGPMEQVDDVLIIGIRV